jgi:hypothetical protein
VSKSSQNLPQTVTDRAVSSARLTGSRRDEKSHLLAMIYGKDRLAAEKSNVKEVRPRLNSQEEVGSRKKSPNRKQTEELLVAESDEVLSDD